MAMRYGGHRLLASQIRDSNPTPQPTMTGTTPQGLGEFLQYAQFILTIIVGVLVIVRGSQTQRREVTIQPGAATREELEKLEKENAAAHTQIFAQLGGVERNLREEIRKDLEGIYERLHTVATTSSSTEAQLRLIIARQAEISTRLDRAIEHSQNEK